MGVMGRTSTRSPGTPCPTTTSTRRRSSGFP